MPATFPSHLAAVLPLKFWRPRWFDGVALAVGSMAPDFAYAFDGSWLERPFPDSAPLWKLAHSLPWFLAWALPVAFLLCPLIRRCAPVVAAHLPALLSPFRGYGSLGAGPRWRVTATSAAIGGASHVLWDWVAVGPLDLASSLLGGVLALWLLIHLARGRDAARSAFETPRVSATGSAGASPAGEARSSSGTSSPSTRRPVVFWGTAGIVFASGAASLPFLPGYFLPHTTSARAILLTIAALLAATAATRSRLLRREPLQQ